MVARYLGVVEAVGSNPATQTSKCQALRLGTFAFRRYSSVVEHQLPKLNMRVRFPLPAPEKKQPLSTKTKVVSFQRNPPCRVGEIIFDDEIPFGDEIRLDGGWVDFISSAKQISSELRSDFIALCAISLKIIEICDIM